MPSANMSPEQRERKRETDRLYRERARDHIRQIQKDHYDLTMKGNSEYIEHKRAYREANAATLRDKANAAYRAKKEADPTYRSGKRGRPCKAVVTAPDDDSLMVKSN